MITNGNLVLIHSSCHSKIKKKRTRKMDETPGMGEYYYFISFLNLQLISHCSWNNDSERKRSVGSIYISENDWYTRRTQSFLFSVYSIQ